MAEVIVKQADITQLSVDAIVNAANKSLLGGGGVDGAIHRAAGPELLEYCERLNGCDTGDAKVTPGFDLPANYVIHTVGPVWHKVQSADSDQVYEDDRLLASCYVKTMALAAENGVKSIAFPAVSCGIYGFPHNRATKIAVDTVMEALKADTSVEQVVFAVMDDNLEKHYKEALARHSL